MKQVITLISLVLLITGCDREGTEQVYPGIAEFNDAGFLVHDVSPDNNRLDIGLNLPSLSEDSIDIIYAAAFFCAGKTRNFQDIAIHAFYQMKPTLKIQFALQDLQDAGEGKLSSTQLLEASRFEIYETPEETLLKHLKEFDVIVKELTVTDAYAYLSLHFQGDFRSEFSRQTMAMALMTATYCPWVDDVIIEYRRDAENYLKWGFSADQLINAMQETIPEDEFLDSIALEAEGEYFVELNIEEEWTILGTAVNDGSGDSSTKGTGGSDLRCEIDLILAGEDLSIEEISGECRYVTLHARYPGGLWEVVYQGEAGLFRAADFQSFKDNGANQIIVSVNGAREIYDPVACEVLVSIK